MQLAEEVVWRSTMLKGPRKNPASVPTATPHTCGQVILIKKQ